MKRTLDRKIFGLGYQHLQHLRSITLTRLVLEPLPMRHQRSLNEAGRFNVQSCETVAFRAVNRPKQPILIVVGEPGLLSEIEVITSGFSLSARRRRTS